ncbi:Cof-type HAD-IIB family hydrolase [Enterococcus sp. 669A]|uniref:Cof-type HAD-IIB family hydrolase n=1 Tax=Candidatus Enterococcus moelleringii TaxID=2815325 RepID=A0ABS3LC10_9ENTE|nr:Cof-type HAD-IIB family hydrolase [Enterococcus sp. 669A]MBO1307172.1 Cof-type HAD-IIB family hydrolase [Enterococcus sp. 669A]
MMNGIVFFDLDGTLLDKKSRLTEQNKEALGQLQKNGYIPVVVSGRAPWEIEELVAGSGIDAYVGLNGQIVFNQKIIYQASIQQDIIEQVVLLTEKLKHSLAFYGSQENKITFVDEAATKLYQLDNAEIPEVKPDYYRTTDIMMLYLFSEEVEKDQMYHQLFQDYLTIVRDSPFSLAMTALGNSKKTGIEHFMNSLSLEKKIPTYAFGDGNNDLPMFEAADYSVAMANGTDEIKAAADFITKAHDDEGIVYGLKHLKLI